MFDEDIRITENIGSGGAPVASEEDEYLKQHSNGNIALAKKVGLRIASETVGAAALSFTDEHDGSFEIELQRGLLLAFASVVAIESFGLSSVLEEVLKNSFFEGLRQLAPKMYGETASSGAFSFYYLAYRRGIELERRIGQTFAMLCSHDGDPVYQELGEAVFCWMRSRSEGLLKNASFVE